MKENKPSKKEDKKLFFFFNLLKKKRTTSFTLYNILHMHADYLCVSQERINLNRRYLAWFLQHLYPLKAQYL